MQILIGAQTFLISLLVAALAGGAATLWLQSKFKTKDKKVTSV